MLNNRINIMCMIQINFRYKLGISNMYITNILQNNHVNIIKRSIVHNLRKEVL